MDREADIYQRIVTAPAPDDEILPGLGATWWRDFTAGFTARMISSTRAGALVGMTGPTVRGRGGR
jgi:hypothetical protein